MGGLGLAAALEGLCERARERAGVVVDARVDPTLDEVATDEFTTALHATAYRLVRRALVNAIESGEADRVTVTAARRGEEIEIVVADNGRGLPSDLPRRTVMRGSRSAVELVGGRVKCFSPPSGGTVVQAVIPVDDAPRFAALARRASADDVLDDLFVGEDDSAPPARRRGA